MMNSALKTAPAVDPISLAEAKEYLRVDLNEDDALITAMITAVTKKVESIIGRKLITQEWETYLDRWPLGRKNMWFDGTREMAISELVSEKKYIELPFGPMQATDFKLETFDNDDVAYEMPSTDYVLDTAGPRGRVSLKLGSVWPTTVLRPINGIKITATYGVDDASDVQDDIKLAIKVWLAVMYEHRGDESEIKCPYLAESLLEPYILKRLVSG
jgi:hypothetical protein